MKNLLSIFSFLWTSYISDKKIEKNKWALREQISYVYVLDRLFQINDQ